MQSRLVVCAAIELLLTVVVLILLGGCMDAWARPPAGTDLDGAVHKWFEAQKDGDGKSCCSISDGHIMDDDNIRTYQGKWEIRASHEDTWHEVPQPALRKCPDNPIGRPVAWFSVVNTLDTAKQQGHAEVFHIYCFCAPTMY